MTWSSSSTSTAPTTTYVVVPVGLGEEHFKVVPVAGHPDMIARRVATTWRDSSLARAADAGDDRLQAFMAVVPEFTVEIWRTVEEWRAKDRRGLLGRFTAEVAE